MWCDASPSIVKIAELASPHVLFPQQYGKQLRETVFAALCDGFAGKNTVKSNELPMFQQKQGPQAHDDSTDPLERGRGGWRWRAHDSNICQAGHNV